MTDPTPAEALMIADHQACEYSRRYGIYAVPVGKNARPLIKCEHWLPRTPGGYDPDYQFLSKHRPNSFGWPTWADAVVALGTWMEGQEG